MQSISNISQTSNIFTQGIKADATNNEQSKVRFSDVINEGIKKVNESQVNANEKIESFIKGENVTMHEIMLSVQESQMSMQLMLEVRNKIYDAYQELSRVQL